MIVFGDKVEGYNYKERQDVYAVIFNSDKELVTTVQNVEGTIFYLVVDLKKKSPMRNV